MNERIYFDHAATTPLDPRVAEAMRPYLEEAFGNPSSLYREGRETRRALDEARDVIARLLNAASPREILFTSGGSEADNLALKGVAWASAERGRHVVTSAIEHHAVLESARFLESQGFKVTYVKPDRSGIVHPEAVAEAITDETVLVSVMHANNETGVVQPVREIAAVARERGVPFHTDAVQSAGQLPIDVEELGCDLLSLSAHKFYGPKGVGILYVRRGTPIVPLIHGGAQEQGRRAGTECVAGIVGMAKALELALAEAEERSRRVRRLRDRLEAAIQARIPRVVVNGHPDLRLPGHLNLCIEGIDAESLLLNLDMAGISASSGSACASGSLKPSHVLLAMGLPRELAMSSLRLTIGKGNNENDVDQAVDRIASVVERLRGRPTQERSV